MTTNQTTSTLDHLDVVAQELTTTPWLIACLCAAWCDTCQSYRQQFNELRQNHRDKIFAWIDIEDHSELIDDLDIENFPTILIEYDSKVLFLGTMLPDASLVHKLILNYQSIIQEKSVAAITASIQDNNGELDHDWSLSSQIQKKYP